MQQFSESQAAQLNVDFRFLNTRRAVEGQTTVNPDDFKVIAVRAVQYGALIPGSVSCWVRAMIELEREGIIKLRKPAPRPVEVTREFRLRVAGMSSSEVRIAYQRDPEFRKLWDAMSTEDVQPDGSVRLSAEVDNASEPELTASGWRGLPPHVASRKMLDPKFRAQVQRLVDQRLI